MASTRAAAGSSDGSGTGLIGSAAELRWSRPDLTGAIADHVVETTADGDDALWIEAAGWAVHARSATNDGRESASDVLDRLAGRGTHLLDDPCAGRLRVELAGLATAAGRVDAARGLLAPVVSPGVPPELRADGYWALARCAVEDRPDAVAEHVRAAEAAWTEVGGPRGDIGIAAVALVEATAERRAGRAPVAVERAAAGLARLDRARVAGVRTPSRHLAAALATEWIFGLLDAGRDKDAREGCVPLEARLREAARPSRQIALLRLAVARTVAASDTGSTVDAVGQAARDAAASDVPDLESVCWSTLGSLQEKVGQLDVALESIQTGVTAQRRDSRRNTRFLAALDAVVPAAGTPSDPPPGRGSAERDGATGPLPIHSTGQWTDWTAAVAQDRTPARRAANGGRPDRHAATGDPTATARDRIGRSSAPDPAAHRAAADPAGSDAPPESRRDVEDLGPVPPRHAGVTSREPGELTVSSGYGLESTRGRDAARSGDTAASGDRPTEPIESTVWTGWSDDSPIGGLLARSLRPGTDDGASVRPIRSAAVPESDPLGAAGGARSTGTDRGRGVRGRGGGRGSFDGTGRSAAGGRSVSAPGPAGSLPPDRHPLRSDAPADPWSTGVWQTASAPVDPAPVDLMPRGSAPVGTDDGVGRSGRRHRLTDHPEPATTGVPTAAVRRLHDGDGGRRRRADPADEPGSVRPGDGDHVTGRGSAGRTSADRPASPGATGGASLPAVGEEPEAPGSSESENWLRAALAELDRAWGTAPTRGEERPAPPRSTDARGCVVVLDLVRDGRRIAGRHAGTVLGIVSDRLADRLPDGARLRYDETDVLTVVLPGRERPAATEWMYRTLPDLLERLASVEEQPGTQIRASVHDADGPVGAQLLQRLDAPQPRNGRTGRPMTVPDPATSWDPETSRPADPARTTRPFWDPDPDPAWDLAPDPETSPRRDAAGSGESDRPRDVTRLPERTRPRGARATGSLDVGSRDVELLGEPQGVVDRRGSRSRDRGPYGSGPPDAGRDGDPDASDGAVANLGEVSGRHGASGPDPAPPGSDPASPGPDPAPPGGGRRRHRRIGDDGETSPERDPAASTTGVSRSGTGATADESRAAISRAASSRTVSSHAASSRAASSRAESSWAESPWAENPWADTHRAGSEGIGSVEVGDPGGSARAAGGSRRDGSGAGRSGTNRSGSRRHRTTETGDRHVGHDQADDRISHDQASHDQAGHDRAGDDLAGRDRAGDDQAGRDWTGHDRAEGDRVGDDQAGYEQVGGDQAGGDWIDRDQAGHDQAGRNRAGHGRATHDQARRNRAGDGGAAVDRPVGEGTARGERRDAGRQEARTGGRDTGSRDTGSRDTGGRDTGSRDVGTGDPGIGSRPGGTGDVGSEGDGAAGQRPVDASTEGLGLADLLAGALAAYRGI